MVGEDDKKKTQYVLSLEIQQSLEEQQLCQRDAPSLDLHLCRGGPLRPWNEFALS
jgi:hypothetical protein